MGQGPADELTILDAAALANRSPETVRRWVWSGRLGARKSGKRLLVARRELEALVDPREHPALSLREWANLAERALRAGSGPHRSAADLVIEERRGRYSEVDHRRRS